jgi:uncharacterized damage-inducible protein DinB
VLSIDLIRQNLERSEEIVLTGIEVMREHCMVPATPRGGAHTLWVLGHLAFIESLVIRQFMLGEATFDGDAISSEREDFPAFDEVLENCRRARAETVLLLDGLAEEDLDAKSVDAPIAAKDLFGTRRSCFQTVADHWYMHRGQLADARRAAGLERAWY